MYVLQLMDWYSASFSVLFIAVVECIVINWIYSEYMIIIILCGGNLRGLVDSYSSVI